MDLISRAQKHNDLVNSPTINGHVQTFDGSLPRVNKSLKSLQNLATRYSSTPNIPNGHVDLDETDSRNGRSEQSSQSGIFNLTSKKRPDHRQTSKTAPSSEIFLLSSDDESRFSDADSARNPTQTDQQDGAIQKRPLRKAKTAAENELSEWRQFKIIPAYENRSYRRRGRPKRKPTQDSKTRSPILPPSRHFSYATKVVPPPNKWTDEEIRARYSFVQKLQAQKGVYLHNTIDHTSPPEDFIFINECVLGKDVQRASDDVMIGCKCHKNHSQLMGCVYLDCQCIEDSAITESNGRRSFPYGASEANYRLLRSAFLDSRYHIYECNHKCDCNGNCKNRVVQHGRTVELEIFKTHNRGWGLRCREPVRKGQFIDTYRGEIITCAEADERGTQMTEAQANNYLFSYDKFPDVTLPTYVCDGSRMSGPSRFINHSCDPNCVIKTVSYNHNDLNIYELAFFALEDIPRGVELTFDYYDDEDERVISDQDAQLCLEEKGYRPTRCLCGATNCRRYFLS